MKILRLIRVHQWVKNLFLLAPIFFSGSFTDLGKIEAVCLTFISFCFVSSLVYVINDYKDIESDKLHPEKKNRPLASGEVSKSQAQIIAFLLLISSVLLLIKINILALSLIVILYLFQNVLYSFGLKKVSILDIVILSFGFVLRVLAGGIATDIEISKWLIIMTFLFALFIAIAKRRDDLLVEININKQLRKANKGYNLDFVNITMAILLSVLLVSYLLYVTSPEISERYAHKHIYVSALFVLVGILRYLQITMVENQSGSPIKVLFKDIFLQIVILAWVSYFAFAIYF